MTENIVILGAGQAGLTAALSLRERGWAGGIDLVENRPRDPFLRSPLTQWFSSKAGESAGLQRYTAQGLARNRITLHRDVQATEIMRTEQIVELSDGTGLKYTALILATGSRPRELTLPGSDLRGIHVVRSVADAEGLRSELARGGHTIFIGGGFLNLEVAVEAGKRGGVTVLESAPHILGRVLSSEAADALGDYQAARGIEIRSDAEIVAIVGINGRAAGVELVDGSVIAADRIVLAIGSQPRDELAQNAGLTVADGIVVDSGLRTSDDRIFAIGDCARFPSVYAATMMRLESVQNASDQGRFVAAVIAGSAAGAEYREVPWFWSTQGERQLQIAGLAMPEDEARVVLRRDSGMLVVERLRRGRVVAVETINAPGQHLRARQALVAR